MNNHNGTCPFCTTNVPKAANTCTGCGAMWGVQMKDGRTIHMSELRQLMLAQIFSPIFYALVTAAIYYFGFLSAKQPVWQLALLVVTAFMGFCTVVAILIALMSLWGLLVAKEAWWKSTI